MIKPQFGSTPAYWDKQNAVEANQETRLLRTRALYAKNLTDGRQIRIDAENGIQALDSQGEIIHDTPDCVIASDMTYGGHIIWKDASNYIDYEKITFTNTNTSQAGYGTLTNTDLTSYLPTGLTSMKGTKIHIEVQTVIYGAKTQPSTSVEVYFRYSNIYNQVPSSYNISLLHKEICRTQDAENIDFLSHFSTNDIIPITWNNEVPYITWRTYYDFEWMVAQSSTYYIRTYIFLMGFTV